MRSGLGAFDPVPLRYDRLAGLVSAESAGERFLAGRDDRIP